MRFRKHAAKTAYIILFVIALTMPTALQGQWAAHSVLRSGSWWKIGIAAEGVYRLGASEVSGLSGCNVAEVALYGQEGGMLNVTNGATRGDDLEEMAIEVHDVDGNGLFDNQDYLLFYAQGPLRWSYDAGAGRWRHESNAYATKNYVFLTAQSGNRKRIEQLPKPAATGTAVTTGHYLLLHEQERTNTHRTGQVWVGERFAAGTTQQQFELSLPAVPTGALRVGYALASVSNANSSFSVSLNGNSHTYNFNSYNLYQSGWQEFPTGTSATPTMSISYQYSESTAAGYLDYIEVDAEVPLTLSGHRTAYRIAPQGTAARTVQLTAQGSGVRVWDVTELHEVGALTTEQNGTQLAFNAELDSWRQYLVFDGAGYMSVSSVEAVANQDLHGATQPDMVIVCHSSLQSQAERLAALHSIEDGLEVLTVSQEAVYNEFSSGRQDPTAIRELLRMYYRRAQADNSLRAPRYLLLFGKGTYDNRDLLGNGLPTVVTPQSTTSFDEEGSSIATDDFFTYLDDGEEGTMNGTMDVGVGRLPAKSVAEAKHMVDKIERYMMRSDLMEEDIRGDWRNYVALLADDADPSRRSDTAFTTSSEKISQRITNEHPELNIDKIYADAYIQQSGADGSYYPDVNNALKKRMDYGCLLLNYIGHGSSQYIGTERFMMKTHISNYTNYHQLPFFITSTCTFGRYDLPEETCGAEEFLLSDGAGIACLAASRPISHVEAVNTDMVMQSLDPANRIGDAIRIAKNNRATTQALTLMGDPALRLSHPEYRVEVTAINGRPVMEGQSDTALVLSTVTIEGEVRDSEGNRVTDFDGTLYATVYDRERTAQTLANDNEGCEVTYTLQNSLLYKGHTTVSGGRFSYHFTVPRDVAYRYERCKLSHYAKSGTSDATGAYKGLLLGGFDESVVLSETRPEVKLYMNDTTFVDGGITDEEPTLLATLFDSIGINAVGSGLGHDITAVLDGNAGSLIILNDLYESDMNDERYGTIRYQLSGLSRGRHTLKVKAWNIFNYSGEAELSFYVRTSDSVATRLRAYPNPATTQVSLLMEHNGTETLAEATVEIYTMQGQRIRSFATTPAAGSYTVGPVLWDLTSENGRRVAPGVYIARFVALTESGERLCETGKIIVGN